jgi:hypothetical protein
MFLKLDAPLPVTGAAFVVTLEAMLLREPRGLRDREGALRNLDGVYDERLIEPGRFSRFVKR